METFKVRTYDSLTGTFLVKEVDLETIITKPYGMHINDIGVIALNQLRKEKGLDPLSNSFVSEATV